MASYSKKYMRKDGTEVRKMYEQKGILKRPRITFSTEADATNFDMLLAQHKQTTGLETGSLLLKALQGLFEETAPARGEESDLGDARELDSDRETSSAEEEDIDRASLASDSTFLGEIGMLEQMIRALHICPGNNDMSVTFSRKGHAVVVLTVCNSCGFTGQYVTSATEGRFLRVNMRSYHAAMCSGMQPVQFEKYLGFLDMGGFAWRVLRDFAQLYQPAVKLVAEQSMAAAIEEERNEPQKIVEGLPAIGIQTDARHTTRKNSRSTDHVCLGMVTHKVLDIEHVTKADDPCAQRHERLGCIRMYEKFDTMEPSLLVAEHVHDRNVSINKIIESRNETDVGVIIETRNSNDRWHATKPIVRDMRKISHGSKKSHGITWHVELSDKCSRVKNHVFWCMDNCDGCPETLRTLILSCMAHFKGDHTDCHESSPCQVPEFVADYYLVCDKAAEKLLLEHLKSLVVYRNAEDYVTGQDTHYVESFNHVILQYLPKGNIFREEQYEAKLLLSVLCWNENVNRRRNKRPCNDIRHSNKKFKYSYSDKSFNFAHDIYKAFVLAASKA